MVFSIKSNILIVLFFVFVIISGCKGNAQEIEFKEYLAIFNKPATYSIVYNVSGDYAYGIAYRYQRGKERLLREDLITIKGQKLELIYVITDVTNLRSKTIMCNTNVDQWDCTSSSHPELQGYDEVELLKLLEYDVVEIPGRVVLGRQTRCFLEYSEDEFCYNEDGAMLYSQSGDNQVWVAISYSNTVSDADFKLPAPVVELE